MDGSDERLLDTGSGKALLPDVSANGKLAFTSDRDGTTSIYVGNLRGGPVRRVIGGPAAFGDFRPRWSPRGNDFVFMRDDGTNQNDVYRVHAGGTGLRQLTSGPRFDEQAQWSPDGTRMVLSVFDGSGGARLHTIAAQDGTNEQVHFFTGEAVSAAFDNFRVESGELTCPSWWRDAGPDWEAGN